MNRRTTADRSGMSRPNSLPAIIAGTAAIAVAGVAIAINEGWLVGVSALLALASVLLVLGWPRPLLADRASRADLQAEAERLARQNDQALARAARFESEAIQARSHLAEAMSSEQPEGDHEALAAALGGVGPEQDLLDEKMLHQLPTDVIIDPDTGLFSQVFFDASLIKRISAARRGLRPLSIAVADVVLEVGTPHIHPAPARPVADVMVGVFREADTLARSKDGLYLILLEDTPENGAIWTLERLRRKIAEDLPGHTLWVGLSCYPAYGFDGNQLADQARRALESAREWQQDRIEVTTSDPDS